MNSNSLETVHLVLLSKCFLKQNCLHLNPKSFICHYLTNDIFIPLTFTKHFQILWFICSTQWRLLCAKHGAWGRGKQGRKNGPIRHLTRKKTETEVLSSGIGSDSQSAVPKTWCIIGSLKLYRLIKEWMLGNQARKFIILSKVRTER